jgi:MFS family permease
MKLGWLDHIKINLFWLAINVRNNAVGALFLPFLVDMFVQEEIKNTALGGLRTAGLIVAMLAQPAFGLLSDRSTSRFGRRRPFFFAGVLFDLLFLAALYYSWNYPTLFIAVILLQISGNGSHGPLQALIPDLVPENQRGVASGVKAIFELLPIVLVGLTIAGLVSQGRFDLAVGSTAIIILVVMLLSVRFVKEQPQREAPSVPFLPPMMRIFGMLAGIGIGAIAGLAVGGILGGLVGLVTWFAAGESAARAAAVSLGGLAAMITAVGVGVWAGVRATLGSSKKHHSETSVRAPFIWWVTNRLLFLTAITSIQSFAPYFLMYAFNIDRNEATGLLGQLMTMTGLFTLVTALPGGWLSDRFGHRAVIAFSGAAGSLGCLVLLGTIWVQAPALIYLAGIIMGLATGSFVTANWALGTRLVPSAEAGRYLGISNLAGAGAGMIGAGMGGPIADYLNGVTPGMGYFVLFGCFAVLFALSAVSVRFIGSQIQQSAFPSAPESV